MIVFLREVLLRWLILFLRNLFYFREGVIMERVKIIETNLQFKDLIQRSCTEKIVIHHTGNPEDDNLSAAEIHQSHLNQGWTGIGYHFVVRKDGSIERGRPLECIGSHTYGYNQCSIGIHVCGNFEIAEPTQEQLNVLPMLIADLCDTYGLIAGKDIVLGHRDLMATACPGENLYKKLQDIRENAEWHRLCK